MQLKPQLQTRLLDYIFKEIYEYFSVFFENLDQGFKRAIVKNLRFRVYES